MNRSTFLLAAILVVAPACDSPPDANEAAEAEDTAPPVRALALIAPPTAGSTCEADPENPAAERSTCDDLTFRQVGPPWMYYTPNPLHLDEFLKLAQSCDGLVGEPLYVTVSGYDPDVSDDGTTANLQVLGLGFSVMATPKTVDCLVGAAVDEYGAIEYP